MNIMAVRALVLIAAVLSQHLDVKASRRRFKVIDGTQDKYSFVVALFKNHDRCIGTLVSPNWVLTATHCLNTYTHVQFGNMTVPFNESTSIREILYTERPPASMGTKPDLGLIYVNLVPMNTYAQLSAVDYKALAGHVIEYGFTDKESTGKAKRSVEPLQFREGVISPCEGNKEPTYAPYLCVAPKCSDRQLLRLPSEPGCPLFHAGKLAGVQVGDTVNFMRSYTPVSPYLSWVHRVITKTNSISKA